MPAERVPLSDAEGRVLADDLAALRTQPPADVSAMDGYAVRADDVATAPARLKLIGEVAAGRPFGGTVGTGEAARIFTGGVLPAGADTVVIQENTARDGDTVIVNTPAAHGRNIRAGRPRFPRGRCAACKAGRRLTGRDVALAAAMNHASAAGASPPEDRDRCDRRRTGRARHRARTGPDRLFQRLRARGGRAARRRAR